MTHTSTEQPELLPCPFCGDHAETDFIPEHHSYAIECHSIGCAARVIKETVSDAIEAWNRRAPAVPVLRSEPVAYLWQHCETGRTRVVMPDMVITADANWIVVGPLYLAAAHQPPEATVKQQLTVEAASVQLPEPVAKIEGGSLKWHIPDTGYSLPVRYLQGTENLYTEHQVRQLLSAREQST